MANSGILKKNATGFVTNTMVVGANTVVIGSKNSDILGTQWLFGEIQWYLGANTAVFGEHSGILANALVCGANSVVY